MNAEARRKGIIDYLANSTKAVSASRLAEEFGVSRQVIVGDIAIIRASGMEISSLARGYVLEKKNGLQRVFKVLHSDEDVAKELNYSRASVSRAINLLKEKEYITINNGIIDLTEHGMNKAIEIYERHEVITKVLIKIGVPMSSAEENACRIEHVVSNDLLEYFKEFVK